MGKTEWMGKETVKFICFIYLYIFFNSKSIFFYLYIVVFTAIKSHYIAQACKRNVSSHLFLKKVVAQLPKPNVEVASRSSSCTKRGYYNI